MNLRNIAAIVLTGAGSILQGCYADTAPTSDCVASTTSALNVCGKGPTVKGIDVSYWQGNINWTAVSKSGVEFAFARVSDGLGYFDNQFAPNWAGMASVGIVRGAYQFFRPTEDPIAQADLLISTLQSNGYTGADMPPVLDLETFDGLSASAVANQTLIWLDYVEQHLGRRPIVYSAAMMSSVTGASGAFPYYPLWVANYGATCPMMPTGWSDWRIWQYTSTGSVGGIGGNVDMNYFNGTKAELLAAFQVPVAQPKPEPEPIPQVPTGHDPNQVDPDPSSQNPGLAFVRPSPRIDGDRAMGSLGRQSNSGSSSYSAPVPSGDPNSDLQPCKR